MSRYKVALISDWYLPRVGGLELHIRDLARELTARGHEAHVICSTPGANDKIGFEVKRLNVGLLPFLQTIRSFSAIDKLEELIRSEKYDIIHAHTALSPLALGAVYVARKLGIPSLLTEHSVLLGAGNLALRSLDRVCGWSTWPTVLTAVSSFVADELREVTGRTDIQVLLNATRTEDWSLARNEELRVTSVMRFTKRKRPLDIVRMIPRIHARLPEELRPKFTIIGDGPERQRVEREAERLGVASHLELPGWKSRQEIQQILARSAVFAVPSEKEALSIVAIEARAAGLPVVARSRNGVREVIEHGVHGLLAKDTDAFVDHIVRLMREPGLRAQMSARARIGLECFGWDQAIERHMRVYELAVQRHHELKPRAVAFGPKTTILAAPPPSDRATGRAQAADSRMTLQP